MQVWSLCQEGPLGEGSAAHSSILAWRIPWTEELGRLQSMGLSRVEHDGIDLALSHTHTHTPEYTTALLQNKQNSRIEKKRLFEKCRASYICLTFLLLFFFFFQSSRTFNLSQNCWSKNHDKTFCFPLHLPTQKTLWEKARVGCLERTASKHVYYQGWNKSPAQVGCMRQLLGAGALGRLRGIGWRGRREGGSGWGIHVNSWLILVNVWQKPLQYCKVISLQLIKINGKKKQQLRRGKNGFVHGKKQYKFKTYW